MAIEIKKVLKETKQLPSNFGFYPKNTRIWFSPMTTREVEILNESELSSKLLFENGLANITAEGIPVEDITFDDFIFINLQRRLYSQTEIRCTLQTICPNCGKKIIDDFDFNEIEFETPKDARVQRCDLGDYTVEIGPLTIGGMITMLNSDKGLNTIDTLAHCIRKIYQKGTTQKDIYTFELAQEIIANTWGEEREILDYIDSLQKHGMNPRNMKCSNCQTTWQEDLGNPETLIFPSSRPRHFIANKVQPV